VEQKSKQASKTWLKATSTFAQTVSAWCIVERQRRDNMKLKFKLFRYLGILSFEAFIMIWMQPILQSFELLPFEFAEAIGLVLSMIFAGVFLSIDEE